METYFEKGAAVLVVLEVLEEVSPLLAGDVEVQVAVAVPVGEDPRVAGHVRQAGPGGDVAQWPPGPRENRRTVRRPPAMGWRRISG